ncbi:hypothetical protein ANRL4_03899 [Anaerolineae bacterium]|nr:hypothetical protein ANRL4_03899 [Anaerolineae bacterium]
MLKVRSFLSAVLFASTLAFVLTAFAKQSEISNTTLPDKWLTTSMSNRPESRVSHSAVWTGQEMIIWGGETGTPGTVNTGYRYNPKTDSWSPITTTTAPAARRFHSAIWTGSEMIIWGGEGSNSGPTYGNGGKYNPVADTWLPITTTNAPIGRYLHAAVWTGSEMLVWGGDTVSPDVVPTNTGGRYDPVTDTWLPITVTNAPISRTLPIGVWAETQLLIWGGAIDYQCACTGLNTGARYDPLTDTWIPMTTTNVPSGVLSANALWVGHDLIVWGGWTIVLTYTNTGARYNPTLDTWTLIQSAGAPSGRESASAVWNGEDMIIWGGYDGSRLNTGGRYNLANDSWISTTLVSAPDPRNGHTAVWTGYEMIVWSGYDSNEPPHTLSTGGRYYLWASRLFLPLMLK